MTSGPAYPMPHGKPEVTSASERLRSGAAALGVELDEVAVARLETFLDELERWNSRLNLVGEHGREALVDRHIIDSLAAASVLAALGSGIRIADLGSGAGLPGIPLAIAVGPREMVLVEPRRKRASFLRAARRALPEVTLTVLERRADELSELGPATFDAVVSRASLSDEELAVAARPLLRSGGLLIAYRGGEPSVDPGMSASPEDGFTAARFTAYQLAAPRRTFGLLIRERSRFT